MKTKRIRAALVAALAGGSALSSGAKISSAATVVPSGGTVGGWEITYPIGITIESVDTGTTNTLDLIKTAGFDSNEGLSITFTQTTGAATQTINIDAENITNNTGTDWSGFQFLLVSDGGGNGAAFASSGQVFSIISPFTSQTFGSQLITLSGGTLATGSTANWGGPNGGILVINPNATIDGTANFDFKEIPLTGPLVPLPAAAWSSASLLVMLGLWSKVKKPRREPAD
jgi:hypothetical protein